jgi:hypothetical protein
MGHCASTWRLEIELFAHIVWELRLLSVAWAPKGFARQRHSRTG